MAGSATLAGILIRHFGYAVPFLATAVLYATGAIYLYVSFRHVRETPSEPMTGTEPPGLRGEGAATE